MSQPSAPSDVDSPAGDTDAEDVTSGAPAAPASASVEPGQPAAEPPSDPPSAEAAEAMLVREGDVAADYLERLLDILDYDGDIDLDVESDRAVVAVVGGNLLTGGYGSVIGASVGALIIAMSYNGIGSARWNSDGKFAFQGAVLLIAVLVNNYTRKKAQEAR